MFRSPILLLAVSALSAQFTAGAAAKSADFPTGDANEESVPYTEAIDSVAPVLPPAPVTGPAPALRLDSDSGDEAGSAASFAVYDDGGLRPSLDQKRKKPCCRRCWSFVARKIQARRRRKDQLRGALLHVGSGDEDFAVDGDLYRDL